MHAPVAVDENRLLRSIPAARVALIGRIARAASGSGGRNELPQRFLRAYFRGVADEDLAERSRWFAIEPWVFRWTRRVPRIGHKYLYSTVCLDLRAPSSLADERGRGGRWRANAIAPAELPAPPLARETSDALHHARHPFDRRSIALKRLYCDHDDLQSARWRRKRPRAGASRVTL